ncbi:MAG: hypothetical protein ACJA0Q_000853 [Saprospiraceae bacterium]|jgi:hypothetical protein
MKFFLKIATILLIAVVVAGSCKKSPIDLGPGLCPTDGFSFSTSDILLDGIDGANQISFADTGLNIRVYFTEKVDWSLKLTSGSSIKSYSGEGDSINVFWYGNSDKLPLFDVGTVTLTLDVGCRDQVAKTFEVTSLCNYSDIDRHFGVLIRDWDKNGRKPVFITSQPAPGIDGYFYGEGIKGGGLNGFSYTDSIESPMGGGYFKVEGETSDPTWYFGAGEMIGIGDAFDELPTTNPDSIYFNILTRTSGDPNVQIQFVISRIDDIGDPLDDADDKLGNYQVLLNADWTDWKFTSVKMSDFASGSGPLSSTTDLSTIGLAIGAAPYKASKAEVNFDFVLITVGEPFLK